MQKPDILLKIANTHGTPTYVYDLDRITYQYDYLKAAFAGPKLSLLYAMKANYNVHILKHLQRLGAGIDAVSPGDLGLALKCGFDPSKIIYTANNMTDNEMEMVADEGVLMNIDSLSRLKKFSQRYPGAQVCLRFNPDVVDGEHKKIMTGGDLTKFGILLEDADKAAVIAKTSGIKIVGLHEHTGSGLINPDSILNAMKNIMTIATPERFPDLKFLDFGGGFKIPYKPDESQIDYKAIGNRVVDLFDSFCRDYGRSLRLVFEPGKFLTAQAGYLLVTVNTIKYNRTRTICGTDSGFPQLIRPMFYDAYHHIDNLTHPDGELNTYDICGNICETGDLFAADRIINKIRENDILSINDAGAYCYAMGGVYNLRPMPAEVMVENDRFYLSRERQTPEQLVDLILAQSRD